MRESGYQSFFVILLSLWKSTQSRRDLSFFFMNRTGAPWGEDIEQSMTLLNDLGFNLCVIPWSLVMRQSCILEQREVIKGEVLREVNQEFGVDKEVLGPDDVNLQTEELHYNYTVLIESPEQEKSSLLHYPTIINFRRIIRKNKLHNYHISRI